MRPDAPTLLTLLQAARSASTAAERQFVLLNRTREALPYHAAVWWQAGPGRLGHSGVSQVDVHGPYGQWLQELCKALANRPAGVITPDTLHSPCATDWPQWWPPHLLWLPGPQASSPALLVVRELPWSDAEQTGLAEWLALWRMADQAATPPPQRSILDLGALRLAWHRQSQRGWHQPRRWLALGLLLIALLPIRPSLRAPGELVPREPTVMRVALDGTVRRLLVEPNETVQAGQPLAELDDAASASRLQAARQALATAEAEWRQTNQQALGDARAKAQLPQAQGKLEQQQTEVRYLEQQARRTTLLAPHAGVVLIEDPGSWAGRTVQAGEAVLRLAQPQDQELEAWLPVGDAIDLPTGSPMHLHLASRPASPVQATLRLYAFEAEPRPDGTLAYRLRGTLQGPATERLGARGTARIDGERVPLIYAMLRRPLAALREVTGW